MMMFTNLLQSVGGTGSGIHVFHKGLLFGTESFVTLKRNSCYLGFMLVQRDGFKGKWQNPTVGSPLSRPQGSSHVRGRGAEEVPAGVLRRGRGGPLELAQVQRALQRARAEMSLGGATAMSCSERASQSANRAGVAQKTPHLHSR